jgi:hypothetical protein
MRSPGSLAATAAILLPAGTATVALTGGVAAQATTTTAAGQYTGTLADGATWIADVPANWNGTLLLYRAARFAEHYYPGSLTGATGLADRQPGWH